MSIRLRVGRAALCALLLAAAPLAAQEPALPAVAARTISYDEALRIALEQNGNLRLAENAAQWARWRCASSACSSCRTCG